MDDRGGAGTQPRVPMLAPFRIRSFRFQWPADLATSWAFEMETIILGWYILAETGSVLLLTLFGALIFVGTLVAPLFGLAGDRIGHRNLVCMMRALYALLAATVMLLSFNDALTPAYVFAITLLAGLVRPSDLVTRNALIAETMPPERLIGATSLSRITMDSARVVGALAGAAMVATLGMDWAYVVILGLYATGFSLTLGVAPRQRVSAARRSPWRDLRDAAVAVRDSPALLAAMYLAFLINVTAYPLVLGLLPYVAREVYGAGQAELGYMVAGFAGGAVAGSLLLSRIGERMMPARMTFIFSLAWYALILAFAHVQTTWLGIVLLVLTGLAQNFSMVPMSVMILRSAHPALRGCIMGMRTLAVYGLPLGLVAAAPLIERFGFAAMATLYGVVGVVCTLLILARWFIHLWPENAPANRRGA